MNDAEQYAVWLGGDCPIDLCSNPRANHVAVMCTAHMSIIPRPFLCQIRRAGRSGDADALYKALVESVARVQRTVDAIARWTPS